ncbi:Sec-independent protein translocase protein TatB [Chthonobacter albigriseus]|uniref:Sec-independent protein translocase protein TatB n=1 Tax=Chthonobacter albigriseus TaxID=1683161 RepID=UPI0015EEC5AA|nr:Sec-independent protein translocase protein TatB [Chthonobacter albigriseus]
MFEIGWSEILVVAVVAIVVVGPKDLPRLLRTVGTMIGKARRMAGDFQSQFNAALREAEREVDIMDAKKQVEDLKSLNPLAGVKDALNPVTSIGNDIKRELTTPMADPKPAATPTATEPAKTGHVAGDHGTDESSAPAVVAPAAPAATAPVVATPVPPAADPVPAPSTSAGDAR